MAYRFTVDPDARRALVTLSGDVTGAEFIAAMDALYLSPAWVPGYDALWDLTPVRALVLDLEDVAAIAGRTRELAPRMGGGRAAFVVPNELHQGAAALTIHLTRGGDRTRRLFGTLRDGADWLDLGRAALG
jgi:hypothetical protein